LRFGAVAGEKLRGRRIVADRLRQQPRLLERTAADVGFEDHGVRTTDVAGRIARRRRLGVRVVRIDRRGLARTTTATRRLEVDALLLGFLANLLDELRGLGLELLVCVLVRCVACGQCLAELALGKSRRAQVEEVLWLRDTRDRILEFRARLGVLRGRPEHERLALFVLTRRNLGLGLRARLHSDE